MAAESDSAPAPETHSQPDFAELRKLFKTSLARWKLECEEAPEDDEAAVAAATERHNKRTDVIFETIEDADPPRDIGEAAALVDIANLVFADYSGCMLDDPQTTRVSMCLQKASRGLHRATPLPSAANKQKQRNEQFTALIGLEDPIRKLAVLARVAADKTIELNADHASLPPEELEDERRNINDAISLVCQVQERTDALAEAFEATWKARAVS